MGSQILEVVILDVKNRLASCCCDQNIVNSIISLSTNMRRAKGSASNTKPNWAEQAGCPIWSRCSRAGLGTRDYHGHFWFSTHAQRYHFVALLRVLEHSILMYFVALLNS